MNAEIQDANIELLIGLKAHLESAEHLRQSLEKLLSLAKPAQSKPDAKHQVNQKAVRHA